MLEASASRHRLALARELTALGEPALDAAEPLDRLLARGDRIARELEEVERRRESLLAEQRNLGESLAEARETLAAAAAALEAWRAAWGDAVREFGLPKEALPGEATQRHDQLLELFSR